MRHRDSTKVLSRQSHARKALVRGLLSSFALHGKIQTTKAKAKVVQPMAERMITMAKQGTLSSRRNIQKTLHTEKAVKAMMENISPRMKERNGGYTRIVKIGPRKGDGADMVQLELIV